MNIPRDQQLIKTIKLCISFMNTSPDNEAVIHSKTTILKLYDTYWHTLGNISSETEL
jgi:hypothetical protein